MADPVNDSTRVVSLSIADQIKGKIFDLQKSLQQNLPNYESLLHTIHVSLSKSPDTVHLLTDDEIGVICSGLSKKTQIVVATKAATTKSAMKNTKLGDLM